MTKSRTLSLFYNVAESSDALEEKGTVSIGMKSAQPPLVESVALATFDLYN